MLGPTAGCGAQLAQPLHLGLIGPQQPQGMSGMLDLPGANLAFSDPPVQCHRRHFQFESQFLEGPLFGIPLKVGRVLWCRAEPQLSPRRVNKFATMGALKVARRFAGRQPSAFRHRAMSTSVRPS